jgi:hypothetical protein
MFSFNNLSHWKTTAAGWLVAALIQWQTTGAKLPQSKDEWISVALALGIGLLGSVLRDPGTSQGGHDATPPTGGTWDPLHPR